MEIQKTDGLQFVICNLGFEKMKLRLILFLEKFDVLVGKF